MLGTAAFFVGRTPFFSHTLYLSPLLLVILLGMLWRTLLKVPQQWVEGIRVAQRPILRWAVAGLGFRLSLPQVAEIGLSALGIVLVCTFSALFFGYWIARKFGLNEKFSWLIGTGGAICGASAIVAADSVLQSEKKEEAYSVAVITVLGTLGILLYPVIGHAAGMSHSVYALWDGASIHEMAQVVAAGDIFSDAVTGPATVVKLVRIALLFPIVLGLTWMVRRKGGEAAAKVSPVPWFLVMFVVFSVVYSWGVIPGNVIEIIRNVVLWMLCVGMAGVGLQTGFQDLRAAGWSPLLAGMVQWIVLSGLAFALATLMKV